MMTASPATLRRTLLTGRWALAAIFLVNGFLIGSWAPQIPLMLPRHAITEFTLGLMILGFGVGAVIAMASTGWLLSRYGSRRVILGFGVVACVSLSAVVHAPTITLAALALVVFGGSAGAMDIGMNANAVALERQMDRAIMSSSHGFWSVGGFIGGGLGGSVITSIGAHNHALVATGVGLLLTLVALPMLITEPEHGGAATGKVKYQWPRGAAIYLVGFIALFSMIPEGAILDWAALYLQKEHGADASVSSLAFALFAGTMAVMRFAGDAVRNRFGAVATMRVSALIAAAGMFAGAVAPVDWMVVAAFAFCGLGVANMVPIAFSAAGNHPGLSPGSGIALVTLMGYSGILVAPSAIGFVAEQVGFRVVFAVLAGLLVVVALNAGRVAGADRPKPV